MPKPSCIYCGSTKDMGRDHIPPKALFTKPYPNNLITVPSCRACNGSLSKDEEFFRIIIASLAQTEKHPAALELFKSKIIRGFKLRPKLANKIMTTVVPVSIYSGGCKVGVAPAYDISNPSFDRVITKIIRGLLYHETGLTVPDGFVIKWDIIHKPLAVPTRIYDTLQNAKVHTFGNKIFEYRAYILEGSASSFWLMIFYGGAVFYGGVFDSQ